MIMRPMISPMFLLT